MKSNRMTKIALSLLGAAALAGAFTLGVQDVQAAEDTANLNVSATVSANCTISTSALAFGAYDPVSANASTPLTGTGGVTVTCTTGSGATITLGQGSNADTGSTDALPLRRMSDGASAFLDYELHQDAARTTLWGNTPGTGVAHSGDGTATAITVYGQVAAGQNVPSGSYGDTVLATVTF